MNLRVADFYLVLLIVLVGLTGCDRVEKVVRDVIPTETLSLSNSEATPVKLVWLIDYPEGSKDAYIQWVASIAETLQAPDELVRLRSYDNVDPDASPNRLVEYEFRSFMDMARYANRPEIVAIAADLPDHTSNARVHTFIARSDYTRAAADDSQVKRIFLIDYPLGGKQAYLQWVASISPEVNTHPELKAIASYDNYYGESPHRLVEFAFASFKDYEAFVTDAAVRSVDEALAEEAGRFQGHVFQLRFNYVKSF